MSMSQNKNNIIIYYREDKVLFRVTKIRNGTIVEVDELLEDEAMANDFVNHLVANTESQYGFTGQYSESPKNRILGEKALLLVKFGNLGIEIGISVKPLIRTFENLKDVHIATESDYLQIAQPQKEPVKKKSFLDRLFSFAD